MDYKQVQSLIKDFEKSALTVLELEFDGVKIKLSKQKEGILSPSPTTIVSSQHSSPKPEFVPATDPSHNFDKIKSPLVGTFYAASAPGNPPFVQVGQRVKKGQVVCIIEAMKIMNEITSPFDGVVEKIEPKSGDAIGFDQVLMLVNTGA